MTSIRSLEFLADIYSGVSRVMKSIADGYSALP